MSEVLTSIEDSPFLSTSLLLLLGLGRDARAGGAVCAFDMASESSTLSTCKYVQTTLKNNYSMELQKRAVYRAGKITNILNCHTGKKILGRSESGEHWSIPCLYRRLFISTSTDPQSCWPFKYYPVYRY